MREQELQEFVATLISERRLVDSIAGWDDVEAVALDRLQGSEKLLLLDNIVLHRAAEAALMIRDRLVHLAPVSDATRSISLDRSERLFADLLYVSPETGSVVVFEIKRARATARETITELLAYEQELRNHLPFAARTDICLVVVSTDYGPLLEHSLSSLITWHGLKILCLEVNESQEVIVRLPWGWTSFGQDVIPAHHIGTQTLSFTPHDRGSDPVRTGLLLTSVLDLIARESDRSGRTGFGFVWENVRYLFESIEPAGLTVAQVNPAGFLSAAKSTSFLGEGQRSPLFRNIAQLGRNNEWSPSSPELVAASQFLSPHGTVRWRPTGSWQAMRSDRRHRTKGLIMDRYAVPVVFNSWGLIGDYTRDLLTNPTRFAATCGELVGGIVDNRNPQFALKVIDTIAPDEKIPTFGAQWFSRLGFRLARLSTYAQAYYIKTDPIVRDRLRSLLAWARADLAIPLTELKIAGGLADLTEGSPRLVIGSRDNDEPAEDADTIRQFVTWVGDELLGGLSHLHAVVLEAAFQNGQALDNALPEIAPRIDLSHITARAIDNARGGLAIAARDAPSRPGGHAGLVALLSDAFKLPCGPDTEPTELAMMIDTIPVNLLLDEYTHAIPAALDIATPVRHFGRHDAGKVFSNGAIAVLRHRIREHRAAGRHVGLYVDPSGEYGICLLEEEVAATFCDPGEESVIVRCSLPGGSVIHILQRWTELIDGLLLG